MAKIELPFGDFDVQKLMGDFDVQKLMGDLKVPSFSADKIMEIQRKNLEAVSAVNKAASEGLQELASMQSEFLKDSMADMTGMMNGLSNGGLSDAGAQVETLKGSLEKLVKNLRAVSELAVKTNTEITNTIQTRVSESVEEIKGIGKGE